MAITFMVMMILITGGFFLCYREKILRSFKCRKILKVAASAIQINAFKLTINYMLLYVSKRDMKEELLEKTYSEANTMAKEMDSLFETIHDIGKEENLIPCIYSGWLDRARTKMTDFISLYEDYCPLAKKVLAGNIENDCKTEIAYLMDKYSKMV